MAHPHTAGILAALVAFGSVHTIPSIELNGFAWGAAQITSLLTGAPVIETDRGWLLPFGDPPLLVSEACSGTTFFIILSILLAWHLSRRIRPLATTLCLSFAITLPLAIFINALRIICLAQAHHWLIPRLPENYSAFAHMLVGVAVFLPSLIALNALLEFYGDSPHPTTNQSH